MQIVSKLCLAGYRRDKSQHTLQECRLSYTVCSRDGNLISTLHAEIHRFGERLILAVSDHQIVSFKYNLARGSRLLEVELRLRFLTLKLNDIHLVKFLLSGHRHISCGNPGFIPRNEILQLGYLLLLLSVRSLKLGFLHRIHLLELVIVAYISVKLAILHMVYNIDNRIQERNIMGYKYKRILVFLKVSLQPLYMVCIKVIRRLVEQKYLRLLKQSFARRTLVLCPPDSSVTSLSRPSCSRSNALATSSTFESII